MNLDVLIMFFEGMKSMYVKGDEFGQKSYQFIIDMLKDKKNQESACEFCSNIDDEFTFYTHTSCDNGYVVEWHDAKRCPMCGRMLKEDIYNG